MSNEDISKDTEDYSASAEQGPAPRPGPFLARVVSHLDPSYMGVLQVELLRPVGNSSADGQTIPVKMMTPFAGATGVEYTGLDPDDYNNTQKSYGMWFVPPDPGTIVIVFFIDGDQKRGYWLGCVLDEGVNFMLPGVAATEQVVEGGGRLPVAEYNKKVNEKVADPTKIKKPKHPLAKVLEIQGLLKDDIRGITTSSARRETPSSVFGISTPGPVDKQSGAKQGKMGNSGDKITTYVSRLGGSTFVMDDGDDKFLRKKPASEGPPEYAAAEQGETGGDVTIPHNELVRIRTRTGHQILLHNSEDLIYIGNAKGTTWIELTSNGKIDIYAKDSVSVHSQNDINFTADRDINLTAGANINMNATGNANLTATGVTNINSTTHNETAGRINMNGPVASKAAKAARIPLAEPWAGHENLNPAGTTPAPRAVAAPTQPAGGKYYKQYTTTTDTFSKIKPPEDSK